MPARPSPPTRRCPPEPLPPVPGGADEPDEEELDGSLRPRSLEEFVGQERVASVETESGRLVDAGMVVMGTGAMPDVMLARSSGLELGETGGVKCSSALEVCAVPTSPDAEVNSVP